MADELVVRDGRVNEEKLAELRAVGAETELLDFKRAADLADQRTKLAFVKDAVALANVGGGYIVVGCDDQGRIAADDLPRVHPGQWEAADLMGLVSRYTNVPVPLSSAVHVVENRPVVVVAVGRIPRDLPAPFAIDGEWYESPGTRPRYEFHRGQIWIRSGPRNVILTFHDWDRVLAEHDELIRQRASDEGRALLDRVLEAFRDDGGSAGDEGAGGARRVPRGPSPLVPGMSWEAARRGIDDALEARTDTRLRRYASGVERLITQSDSPLEQRQRAIDELVNLAIQADELDREDVFELAVSSLHRAYGARDTPPSVIHMSGKRDEALTRYWLEIAIRVMGLGAYLVRRQSWAHAHSVFARSYNPSEYPDYRYLTWLRHAQVQGSRAGLLSDAHENYLSLAREAAVEEPVLRPDLTDAEPLEPETAPEGADPLLDSLAQFDALCTVMANAESDPERYEFYPSFAALRTERALPILNRIASDEALRRAAFPTSSDRQIAVALVATIKVAQRESRGTAGVWFMPASREIERFVLKNA